MKNSKASDEENVRWLREKEKESFRRKTEYMNQQSNPRRRGMVKGGDSIAWDDGASFAASSLASGGAVTAAAGGSYHVPPTNQAPLDGDSIEDDQGYQDDGRLAVSKLLKYDTIKGSMYIPRVDQATFVKMYGGEFASHGVLCAPGGKVESCRYTLLYTGTISYQDSISDEVSYGTRLPVNKSAGKTKKP